MTERPPPASVEPLTAEVSDVLFCHWPVRRDDLERTLPGWLDPDTADGSAWTSAVALRIDRFEAFGIPVRENLGGVNLRSYVRGPRGDRGVYFHSLDLTDRLAVETGRRLFRLPYEHAAVDHARSGEERVVDSRRRNRRGAGMIARYVPASDPGPAAPGTLASFLVERYRYFTPGPLGVRLVGSVGHDPWRVGPVEATVEADGLLAAAGLEPAGEPLVHSSPGLRMTVGAPEPVGLPVSF